jgi:hypothetical protein
MMMTKDASRYTVKPVLRGHLWDKEIMALYEPLTKRFNSFKIFYDRTRKCNL